MNENFKKHGAFSWSELLTSDVEGAKGFYSELLGWTLDDMECSGNSYTVIKSNDEESGGIMKIPAEAADMPPNWGVYVTVDDVDLLIPRVEELGGQIRVPPQDIPNVGRFAVIQDPQGAALSLISYTEEA